MKVTREATAMLFVMIVFSSIFTGCLKETTIKTSETTNTNNLEVFKLAKVGDIIHFGRYEQDNDLTNGMENIAWQVLAVENNKRLLISDSILDVKPYDIEKVDVEWSYCTLRNWLNDDFFNSAFSAEDRALISSTILHNKIFQGNTAVGEYTTSDRVFLFNREETEKYFTSKASRVAQGSNYSIAKKLYCDDFGHGVYWLRTSDDYLFFSCYVGYDSKIHYSNYINQKDIGVRPCLWLFL